VGAKGVVETVPANAEVAIARSAATVKDFIALEKFCWC